MFEFIRKSLKLKKGLTVDDMFVSVLQPIKNIEKRNIAFDALSDRRMRQEIMWDALQLVIQQIVSTDVGSYWSDSLLNLLTKSHSAKEFQLELNDIKSCSVCVRGGAQLSLIRLGNKIAPDSPRISDGYVDNIRGFTIQNYQDMESIYEFGDNDNYPYHYHTTGRLANIYCNVIINGYFKPLDKTDYLKKYNIQVLNT
jgi:hypothetical protein